MSDSIPPPDNTSDLQFNTATFTNAPPATICAVCQQPIQDTYFSANNKLVCPRCRDGILRGSTGGSRIGRFSRAVVFGTFAAIGAGFIWWLIRRMTGYEIGLIAIVVGLMVGGAVRQGARGRGGIGYQLLAVFLTYACIVSTYVPMVYSEMVNGMNKEEPIAATQPETRSAVAAAATSRASTTTAATAGTSRYNRVRKELSPLKRALFITLVLAACFIFALFLPILAGLSNILGLLIIGFALWEAWKINKRVKIEFAGPFSVGAAPPQPPPPLAGPPAANVP